MKTPHLKINIRKNICPISKLPEGYTVTLIDVADLTPTDRENWRRIQLQRENVKTHHKLRLPEQGLASFAKYHGELIGCGCMEHISDDTVESKHLMILPDHRRKGIFKALMKLVWQHSYLNGYTWINLSPVVQANFWKRHGAEMGWAT